MLRKMQKVSSIKEIVKIVKASLQLLHLSIHPVLTIKCLWSIIVTVLIFFNSESQERRGLGFLRDQLHSNKI